jgi:hypothetical protein
VSASPNGQYLVSPHIASGLLLMAATNSFTNGNELMLQKICNNEHPTVTDIPPECLAAFA